MTCSKRNLSHRWSPWKRKPHVSATTQKEAPRRDVLRWLFLDTDEAYYDFHATKNNDFRDTYESFTKGSPSTCWVYRQDLGRPPALAHGLSRVTKGRQESPSHLPGSCVWRTIMMVTTQHLMWFARKFSSGAATLAHVQGRFTQAM